MYRHIARAFLISVSIAAVGVPLVAGATTEGDVAVTLVDASGYPDPSLDLIGTAAKTWRIEGVGDFNGNGRADILWLNTLTREVAIWFMNGTTLVGGYKVTAAPVGTNWDVQGVGDFSGDGKDDILWLNTLTREVAIWLMNGTTISSAAIVQTVAASWGIEGVADFNDNGRADILWRNTGTGDVAVWLMNGITLTLGAVVQNVPISGGWQIAGVGDFNGNGRADILWRSNSGVAVWLMDGTTLVRGYAEKLGPEAEDWDIRGAGDFDGDGHDDILWRDTGS